MTKFWLVGLSIIGAFSISLIYEIIETLRKIGYLLFCW
jgi:hypothetical protein